MKLKTVGRILKETALGWQKDKVAVLAAALAYYTTFSLAPLLVLVIAIAGAVFGQEAVRGEIVGQIQGLVGQQGAEAIQAMLQNAYRAGSGGVFATIASLVTLLLGASGVFGQLQEALNTIWHVEPRPGAGIKDFIHDRFLSFAMILVIGFLLLVSLVLSAVLAGISAYISHFFPTLSFLGRVVNFLLSFGVITVLFALIYKVLPDVKVPSRALWVGSIVTALLFNLGKFLLGSYLGSSSITSSYGAAASLAIVLIWIFYSVQILLIGAEFIKAYSNARGMRVRPTKNAVLVER
ncbi:YihY/virulence factor BrkB family protein [Leptolyngbya sp. FACHB-711]|uniref:YihY/virulence factor BrkB family protein n=1 Tax=unclassified Leptolyngbya TaxID=2650499 RepID=UPI001681DDC5|nr:YihY/virulence factor BrkB family protein [Leptolyngbya sp. FACHB-711]MBD1849990.1 YihY/virulence factor BrkB family protein [Cyanobacteria bacterium FACHB-502]MBD2027485.1 YihY/virulence factor BrkB family protein [Leptolyngbya sp. FACHB-711]